jgi:hypothetical protein
MSDSDGQKSWIRRRAHQSIPFAEGSAKSHLADGLATEESRGIASFAALGVVRAPVIPARDEDVNARILLGAFPPPPFKLLKLPP